MPSPVQRVVLAVCLVAIPPPFSVRADSRPPSFSTPSSRSMMTPGRMPWWQRPAAWRCVIAETSWMGHEALDVAEGEAAAPSAQEVGQGDGAGLVDEDKGAISDEGGGGNVQVGVPEAPRRS